MKISKPYLLAYSSGDSMQVLNFYRTETAALTAAPVLLRSYPDVVLFVAESLLKPRDTPVVKEPIELP